MSSQKKKKVQKPRPESTDSTDVGISDSQNSSQDMVAKFEQELVWCIEQLQLGLETQNPSSRQAVEATRALKILLSAKAPVIKKRQVMRNTFGDYRKKMAEMERKSSAAIRKGSKANAVSKKMQKSTYFKKSVNKVMDGVQSVPNDSNRGSLGKHSTTCDESSVAQTNVGTNSGELNSNFQFNFTINENSSSNAVSSTTLDAYSESVPNDIKDNVKTLTDIPFAKSDNSFRFNFTLPAT